LLTSLARRVGRIGWLPRALPVILAGDRALARVTRGRLTLLDLAGLPNLRLQVLGRRSGVLRTTPLLCAEVRGCWLIAGSNFGRSATPDWVHNLRAADHAVIIRRGRRIRVMPIELGGAERAAGWQALNDVWPNYATYEARTERTIPVFRLTRS
jgi:deazaflavin-dependent oxidoreductase (nitroreductase family)